MPPAGRPERKGWSMPAPTAGGPERIAAAPAAQAMSLGALAEHARAAHAKVPDDISGPGTT